MGADVGNEDHERRESALAGAEGRAGQVLARVDRVDVQGVPDGRDPGRDVRHELLLGHQLLGLGQELVGVGGLDRPDRVQVAVQLLDHRVGAAHEPDLLAAHPGDASARAGAAGRWLARSGEQRPEIRPHGPLVEADPIFLVPARRLGEDVLFADGPEHGLRQPLGEHRAHHGLRRLSHLEVGAANDLPRELVDPGEALDVQAVGLGDAPRLLGGAVELGDRRVAHVLRPALELALELLPLGLHITLDTGEKALGRLLGLLVERLMGPAERLVLAVERRALLGGGGAARTGAEDSRDEGDGDEGQAAP